MKLRFVNADTEQIHVYPGAVAHIPRIGDVVALIDERGNFIEAVIEGIVEDVSWVYPASPSGAPDYSVFVYVRPAADEPRNERAGVHPDGR